MISLSEDLQKSKSNIAEFKEITQRVLNYIPDVLNEETKFGGYIICSSNIAGTKKSIRPFREDLFLRGSKIFEKDFKRFESIVKQLKNGGRVFNKDDYHLVDSVVYTIQQAMGIGLDLMVHSNSARNMLVTDLKN